MIARAALLRRLPRRLDYLDYDVPKEMKLTRGDLVLVPFRNAAIRGVVLSLEESSMEGKSMKAVEALLEPSHVDPACLDVLERTGQDLFQSTSTLLYAALGSKKKERTFASHRDSLMVRQKEVVSIQEAATFGITHHAAFIESSDLVHMLAVVSAITKQLAEPPIVLVPHVRDLRCALSVLPASVVVGTRSVLLGRRKPPKTIIVMRSGSHEHAQYDRNPRYDARDLAWQYHLTAGTRVLFLDVSPRIIDLDRFKDVLPFPEPLRALPAVVGIGRSHEKWRDTLVTETLFSAVQEALQNGKKVLISYNRKGDVVALVCKDCGTTALTELCPSCHGSRLKKRGIGNREIERALKRLFPNTPVVRIEKGSDETQPAPGPEILLVTQYYFESVLDPLHLPDVGLVAELMADRGLADPHPSAIEQTILRMRELIGIALRASCPCIIQAWDDTAIQRLLARPLDALKKERTTRAEIFYPPFGHSYRLRVRGKERTAETAFAQIKTEIHNIDPDARLMGNLEIRVKDDTRLKPYFKNLPDDIVIEIDPEK